MVLLLVQQVVLAPSVSANQYRALPEVRPAGRSLRVAIRAAQSRTQHSTSLPYLSERGWKRTRGLSFDLTSPADAGLGILADSASVAKAVHHRSSGIWGLTTWAGDPNKSGHGEDHGVSGHGIEDRGRNIGVGSVRSSSISMPSITDIDSKP